MRNVAIKISQEEAEIRRMNLRIGSLKKKISVLKREIAQQWVHDETSVRKLSQLNKILDYSLKNVKKMKTKKEETKRELQTFKRKSSGGDLAPTGPGLTLKSKPFVPRVSSRAI